MQELSNIINQMDLAKIYRKFHLHTKESTFSAPYGNFSKINHMTGHKASFNRYKKVEITPCILSNHHSFKLEIHNNRNKRKYTNSWKLKKSPLNENWFKTEIKMKLENVLQGLERWFSG